ncbi:MAG: hypothetical protein ABI282_09450, partial [Candidatus Baltobacteraceae bacterium]
SPTPLPTPPPLGSALPTATPANPAATTTPASAAPDASAPTPTPNAALDDLLKQNGVKATPAAKGTPTPPPDNRKGIEGVWEVQIQRDAATTYTHFKIAQTGNALTGTYLDTTGKRYPVAGSLDGTQVHLVVSLADGTTILLQARLDGTTDMLGMFTNAKESVPFTAAYRPKEKWFENVNPQPGGMGGGGYSPPQ